MAEATVIINGIRLTDSQSMVLRMAMSSFEGNLSSNGLSESNTSLEMTNLYQIITAEILQLIGNNKGTELARTIMIDNAEIKARNKAIYEAIEIHGESIVSQMLKHNIARGTTITATRKHKLEIAKSQSESDQQIPINSVDKMESTSLDQDINVLVLTARSLNALRNGNIHTISDLIQKTDSELLSIVNLGITSLIEIKRALSQFKQKLNN